MLHRKGRLVGKYSSISELLKHERKEIDYRISFERRARSSIAIVAPHGGAIEPRTSDIAQGIAGSELHIYCFEGIKSSGNYDALHVTSHSFDEQQCLDLIADARVVMTIHGCRGSHEAVYLGGLDAELIETLAQAFRAAGLAAHTVGHDYPGTEPLNICNRGATRRGVQLELTRGLRQGKAAGALVSSARQILLAHDNVA